MTVQYDFSRKTAVVTGGAKGIGRAIAERLRSCGAQVLVWDTTPVRLEGIASLVVDVTRSDQIVAAVSATIRQSSGIDLLINNAGYLGAYAAFEKLTPEDQRRIIEVNLVGTLEVCRQVLPHMREAGRGSIVNMGSLAGKEGLRNLAVYSAASGGVIAFTKALAKDLAETGIRVNCIAPGPIETDLIKALGPDVVASMVASSPMKRLGDVEEVAELVAWLCSDACSFNTGAVFDMSGGRATY
jgi:NAD(P)-dependent dehydrogenase (short-subunit alcohol dehydrogenase family)